MTRACARCSDVSLVELSANERDTRGYLVYFHWQMSKLMSELTNHVRRSPGAIYR